MARFLRYNQICDEKLPLVKIRKNKPKSEIPLSQLLITRDIQNLLSREKQDVIYFQEIIRGSVISIFPRKFVPVNIFTRQNVVIGDDVEFHPCILCKLFSRLS